MNDLERSSILHLQDVYQAYDSKLILDNIDLSIEKGEFVTVVGPSGCGKSTLLRLIIGQESPVSGKVLLDGSPMIHRPGPDRGIVYQNYSLFQHLTVLENVLIGFKLRHGVFGWAKARRQYMHEAMQFLKIAGVESQARKYPQELSGGQRQRVAIVQALILRPKILCMDEPFSALDPGSREKMQVFLLKIWEEMKLTVFFVTHDLDEAAYLGSRLIALSQYYTDDRGDGPDVMRGAKVVGDFLLDKHVLSPEAKQQPEFREFVVRVRDLAFKPTHITDIRQFALEHPRSFRTPTPEEIRG